MMERQTAQATAASGGRAAGASASSASAAQAGRVGGTGRGGSDGRLGDAGRADGSPAARRSLFLRSTVFDLALVLVVSVALTLAANYGFYSADAYRSSIGLIVAVELPLLLIMYAGSWSKRALVPAIVGAVAYAAVVLSVAVALSPDPVMDGFAYSDTPGNFLAFGALLVVMPVLTYLLSRRPAGMVFLLFFGFFVLSWVQYLWRDWMSDQSGIAVLLVAVVGLGALFVYQTYRTSSYQAKHAKTPAFAAAFGMALLIGCACVAIAAALFYAVINPLGLNTIEIKPFQYYYSAPVQLYTGTFTEQQIQNNETSDDTNDDQNDTNSPDASGDQSGEGSSTGDQTGQQDQTLQSAYDASNWNQSYQNISYFLFDWLPVILAILVVAAVVAAILIQRARREWRLRKLADTSYSYRIWYLYTFLLGRFRRLKLYRPANLTPMEFALGTRRALTPFAEGTGGVDFVEVTRAYQEVCYGKRQASEQDYRKVEAYYRAFFGNARKHVGGLKWLWKFWRI